jgi:hypothetical protein
LISFSGARPAHALRRVAWCLALALVLPARHAEAQTRRTVEGRVVRPLAATPSKATPNAASVPPKVTAVVDTPGVANVPGVMVTLHRVTKGGQGAPLDSVRTNSAGLYQFSYTATDTTNAIYFTSTTYGGIAYFTAPMRGVDTRDRDAEITVFDTTSRPVPLSTSGRHLIVSAIDTSTNERTVVEVFELSNDSTLTLVSGNAGKAPTPTWSVGIPAEARKFKANDGGDVSPGAVSFERGRVALFAPLAPGVKQVSFSYHLPVEAFPLTVTIDHGAVVLEVLLEDAEGTATGAKLVASDPVAVEGRNFRRFLAQDVHDGDVITLSLPAGPSIGRKFYLAALVGTLGVVMLLILLRTMQRRRPVVGYAVPVPYRAPDLPLADRLAREIADLDDTFARTVNHTDSLRAAYETRRAELKDALAAELARR